MTENHKKRDYKIDCIHSIRKCLYRSKNRGRKYTRKKEVNITIDDLHTLPKKMFENYLNKIQIKRTKS